MVFAVNFHMGASLLEWKQFWPSLNGPIIILVKYLPLGASLTSLFMNSKQTSLHREMANAKPPQFYKCFLKEHKLDNILPL